MVPARAVDFTQAINEFLRRLHLGSEVYYVGQLCDAWHMSTAGGKDVITFHLVCHGEAWIHMPSGKPTRMCPGDIAFFANDAAHSFSADAQLPEQAFDHSCPMQIDKSAPGSGLLCGHLRLPDHIRRLLLASAPDFILVRPAENSGGDQMRRLIELMTEEAVNIDLGGPAVLDRLSDTLFLFVIRYILHNEPKLSPLLAALADHHLRPALTAFINHPADTWTVESLAKAANQSRSAFAERFSQHVKMSPIEFITTWRMQMAVDLLADSNANVLDVAIKCGYESEAAFRKAFKRIIGVTPGKVRR